VAVLGISDDELIARHIKEWQMFWNSSQIALDGDDELVSGETFSKPSDRFGCGFRS
jgi:hypothetical protein